MQRISRLVGLLFLFVAAFSGAPANGQGGATGAISGVAVDTGGGAVANIGVSVCNSVFLVCTTDSSTVWGWTVGGGLEWAVWDNWSFKAEYLHVDFGTHEFINPPVVHPFGTTLSRNVPVTDELFRVGLNYRFFGGGSVMSRY